MQKILLGILCFAMFSAPAVYAEEPAAAAPAPAAAPAQAAAAPADALSPAQESAVEDVVRKLLTEKEPDIIVKAFQTVQQREQSKQFQQSKTAVSESKDRIFNNPEDPILGNPKGDVTIVEFYDYQCHFCKQAHEAVVKLLAQDKNIRFIAKEFPILGDGSVLAARAALASIKQKKFDKMHDALMKQPTQFNESVIMDIAKKNGLDAVMLKKDMADKHIDEMIATNRQLGVDLGVRGTPMFLIGEETRPGALPLEDLKKMVADIRASQAKK
ncbi:MAG: DsbA family protein [Alphaproteobacteria bacterium]